MDVNKDAVNVVDLVALAQESTIRQPVWAYQSTDLNMNLLVWGGDEGVVEHVNSEVDVLLVGIAGDGLVEVGGLTHPLRAGQAIIIPKGVRRAIRSTHGRFAYLTCHRKRAGLWPHRRPATKGHRSDC
jgi:mannose-6-phosphate isomerase-like protein (cupin superfamily)